MQVAVAFLSARSPLFALSLRAPNCFPMSGNAA
jgi:hypothetical protein